MATIPLTLCGLMLAKTFVLVGDHMQLPPITRTPLPPSCTLSEKCGFCESMFRLLIEQYPQKSQLLDLQFRSHPLIMGFSAQFIYRGKIRSSEECYNKKLQLRNLLHEKVKGIINEEPICYVDMQYSKYDSYPVEWFPTGAQLRRKNITPSCFNAFEASMALTIRHEFMRAGIPAERIWIITPFRLQREILRKCIKGIYGLYPKNSVISIYENLAASTVDSIQGKENDVIIYSLTWVPPFGRGKSVHKALKDIRRLNVALTRARKKLVVIGDLTALSWQYPYGPLEKYIRSNGSVIEAPIIKENNSFLIVAKFYFEKKKYGSTNLLLQEKANIAKRNLRNEVKTSVEERRIWKITSEVDFQNFVENGVWKELDTSSKKQIYDCRLRNETFNIIKVYDKEKGKAAIHLIRMDGKKVFLQYM